MENKFWIDVKTLGGTFLSKAQGGRELITAVSWKNDQFLIIKKN